MLFHNPQPPFHNPACEEVADYLDGVNAPADG
jgi:hypothetical protein